MGIIDGWGWAESYLTRRGSESVGNLILGTEALDRHLSGAHGPRIVPVETRAVVYPALAQAAMSGAPPGSSAHGQHPKFSARLTYGQAVTHVLVKFSPPRDTPLGVRWADLLTAEYLASLVLNEHGIAAARNELLGYNGQVFLQSERFDRVGANGRRGVVSLYSVDVARYGMLDHWSLAAQRLHSQGLLSQQDLERITLVDTFGGLICLRRRTGCSWNDRSSLRGRPAVRPVPRDGKAAASAKRCASPGGLNPARVGGAQDRFSFERTFGSQPL